MHPNWSYILLLLDMYPWAKMGRYSFCFTTVTEGQIGQILSLHVKKERPNWPFTPLHNSKNTKLMQILIGLLERAHENPGTESQLSTLLLSISKTKLITTFGRFSHTFLSRILNDFIKGVRSFQPNQQRGP